MTTLTWLGLAVLVLFVYPPPHALAQDAHVHDASTGSWQWGIEGTAFGGYNYQRREFTDFDEVESQNWLMTSLGRSLGAASHLELIAMFSLEPLTIRDLGSPQVFQTGETFGGRPLIDYQHPHDLVMNLGAELTHSLGATMLSFEGYAVGPAPYGPPVFMHRPSAAENPQVPLSHHSEAYTLRRCRVVRLDDPGSRRARAFHGASPRDRLDIDRGRSISMRPVVLADGPWSISSRGRPEDARARFGDEPGAHSVD